MKSFVDEIKDFIRRSAEMQGKPNHIETSPEALTRLRLDLGLKPDDPVIIDGVPIILLSKRDDLLGKAVIYAAVRWHVNVVMDDMISLFKAVPDEELKELIPIIMAQHFDDHGFADPVDDLDDGDVKELKASLKEVGIEDPDL